MTGRLSLLLLCLLAGCTAWRQRTGPHLPQASNLVLDQLVVYSDAPLPQRHRLLEELNSQRSALRGKLGLPTSDERIYVYLFAGADELRNYMQAHHPTFPERRAFFVETDTRLQVYAYWGDRVAEDLRHEVAHGYLHSVVPHIPLWVDEGLAEYFEVPRSNQGLNERHVHELSSATETGWRPDLRRLEQLRSAADMTQLDYAESWAWVYFLLQTTPERQQVLRDYLHDWQNVDSPEALSTRLRGTQLDYERQLLDYVAGLAKSLR